MWLIVERSLHACRHGTLRCTCWRSCHQSGKRAVLWLFAVRFWSLLILHTVYFLSSHHIYYSRCDVKTGHCDSRGKDGNYGVKRRMEADVPWRNWGYKPNVQIRRLCTRFALSDYHLILTCCFISWASAVLPAKHSFWHWPCKRLFRLLNKSPYWSIIMLLLLQLMIGIWESKILQC